MRFVSLQDQGISLFFQSFRSTSRSLGTGRSLWGLAARHKANVCPLSSANDKNIWSYTFIHQWAFTAWSLIKCRTNFTVMFHIAHNSAPQRTVEENSVFKILLDMWLVHEFPNTLRTLDASSPLCFMRLGRGRYIKKQLSLYPVYYADDDVFRPLWAIFRSKKWTVN